MSFVHFLTIGRFAFQEGTAPPSLADRVVAHFVPDGLRQLGRDVIWSVPFTPSELAQIENEVRGRYGIEQELREHLTDSGLICLQYTGTQEQVAPLVALVAHDLFGAVAAERGEVYELDYLKGWAERAMVSNLERKRLFSIEDPKERVFQLLQAVNVDYQDPKSIPVWLGVQALRDVAAQVVPELIAALKTGGCARALAAITLSELGEKAAEAIPALVELVRQPEKDPAFVGVTALGSFGSLAEEGLVFALEHSDSVVRWSAIQALGDLPLCSESTLDRLRQLAEGGEAEESKAARAVVLRSERA